MGRTGRIQITASSDAVIDLAYVTWGEE